MDLITPAQQFKDALRKSVANLWWCFNNKHRLSVMKSCHVRVRKELDLFGIKLPVKFKATSWYWDAEYLPSVDEIHMPFYLIDSKYRASKESLSDYVRHEYGHAFQAEYEKRGWSMEEFYKVFGTPTDKFDYQRFIEVDDLAWDKTKYVTKYAQYDADEDFAETFALYLRKKGDLKSFKKKAVLLEKLKTVQAMVQKFSA